MIKQIKISYRAISACGDPGSLPNGFARRTSGFPAAHSVPDSAGLIGITVSEAIAELVTV